MVETQYKIPGAPHLALLADLHGRPYQSVVESLRRHKPDLICIVGDILYGTHPENDRSPLDTQENVLPFLKACADFAPSFLSLGNHEWMLDEDDLLRIKACGITIFDNDFKAFTLNGRQIVIGGLTSAYCLAYRRYVKSLSDKERAGVRYPRKETVQRPERCSDDCRIPDTSWLVEFSNAGGWHILLSHHPEYWPLISPQPIELCLSAHAHGGQWRIFNHGVFAPGQGFWPKLTSGVYDGRLVISRGLSNTTKVPRLFNPTEVVYVEGY